MEHFDDYIGRITRLANRNKVLMDQMEELVHRYEKMQQQKEKYQNLLTEYSSEVEDKKLSLHKRAYKIKMASLLYVSVSGFHKITVSPNAEIMMDLLDEMHIRFEIIAKSHHLVKVKGFGDNSLFAGGVLEENRTNPIDVVLAALEMRRAAAEIVHAHGVEEFWDLGMGVHTGTVLAEPTGKKHTPFYLYGGSVDIAARMGMASGIDQINISVMTFELVKEFFNIDKWGSMPVKYKGHIDMFFVVGVLPHLSENLEGEFPAKEFLTKYQQIQFMDIQEDVLDLLEQSLPTNLHYHNVKHTIDVVTEVELIGWAEGLGDEEVLMLKLAALFHDSGHTVNYENHEYHGTQIAKKILPQYRFGRAQIDHVCRLIMATKFPPEPKDKLEEVICDSDLDYLGRSDFIPVSNNLYKELKERSMIGTFTEWNKLQLKFILKHQYFTETARNLREVNKQNQIDRIKMLIEKEIDVIG